MSGKQIFKGLMYAFWLLGLVLMWVAYGWRAAAISWLIGSSFGTAMLMEVNTDG